MKLQGTEPLSGRSVNVLDPAQWAKSVVGMGYTVLVVAAGYYLYRRVNALTAGTALGPMTTLPQRHSGVPAKLRIVHGL